MLRYAFKNAFRRRNIAAVSIIGIAIGVSLMTAMASLSATISDQTNKFAQQNLDSITVQQKGQLIFTSQLNFSKIYNITRVEHIEAYSGQVIATVQLGAGFVNPQLVGVNVENDTDIGGPTSSVMEGRIFQKENECIIGKMSAEFLKLKLGENITLYTPDSKIVNLTITGLYETSNILTQMNIYTRLETARLFKPGFTNNTYSILLIKADNPDNVNQIKSEIERISAEEELNLEVILFEEQLQTISQYTSTINILVISISLIAGIAGGMSIVVAMLMSVIERLKEYATLKATGWQNTDVIKDIIYESLIVTAVGGVVGFAIGILYLGVVSAFFNILLNPLHPMVLVEIILFVIGMGIVGGLYPAYKASKASPVEILRGA
ncbi:MAG: FtsX-like permease family protein [Candidatus Odinarchaeota archaeon]